MDLSDNKVPSKSPPPCSSASLEDVLQQLSGIRDEVLSTGASGPRDGLQLHLDLQLEKVYMLHQNPQVFENSEVRSTFLRKAKKLLLGIRKLADFHIATNAQILKFETTDDELRRGVQFVPPRGPTTVPWNAWCMNDAPFPRKEILQLSIQQGVPVQISSQYLPRGGVFILMRWLQEAKQLVNSMLEVRYCFSLTPAALTTNFRAWRMREGQRSLEHSGRRSTRCTSMQKGSQQSSTFTCSLQKCQGLLMYVANRMWDEVLTC